MERVASKMENQLKMQILHWDLKNVMQKYV